ncbi:MAG: cytochrome b N-terminal domain-containing protein [Candidatus Scalinduaceae bacterium]
MKIIHFKELLQSIFRHGMPNTDKNRSLVVTSNVFLHLHPVKVRKHGIKFWYTMGLGGTSFLLFIILAITGALLMLYYTPVPSEAYRSMKDITFAVSFGEFQRNLHRWAAHGMVITVFLHVCRVFYTAAYKPPREFNWVIGVFLLLLTLGLSFTGYLLPWDQLSFWAITVGANIAGYAPFIGEKAKFLLLGGNIVGGGTLLRFYVLHCFALPLLISIFMAIHFWRVRKDGGISGPPVEVNEVETEQKSESHASEKTYGLMALVEGESLMVEKQPEDTVFTWPHLVLRELLWAMFVINILVLISLYFSAPLEDIANPYKTPNPAKAPWYFLGLQELVHYSAFMGGIVAPTLAIIALIILPYIDRRPVGEGVWFSRERKWVQIVFTICVVTITVLTIIGVFFRGANWSFVVPW